MEQEAKELPIIKALMPITSLEELAKHATDDVVLVLDSPTSLMADR